MAEKILKSDQYSTARGGWSSLVTLTCDKCSDLIGEYQKDGGGPFKRLYEDRLQNSYFTWQQDKIIACRKCEKPLAACLLYKKESRPSFALFASAVKAKPQRMIDSIKIILNAISQWK